MHNTRLKRLGVAGLTAGILLIATILAISSSRKGIRIAQTSLPSRGHSAEQLMQTSPPVGIDGNASQEGAGLMKVGEMTHIASLPDWKVAVGVGLEKAGRLLTEHSGAEKAKMPRQNLQIPDDQLKLLSTDELLDKVMMTPRVVELFLFDPADGGLARFLDAYNGAKVFVERPDCGRTLLGRYARLCKEVDALDGPLKEGSVFDFTVLDVLLSSRKVVAGLNGAERRDAVGLVVRGLGVKERFDKRQSEPVYGGATSDRTALALGTYLEALGSPEYGVWHSRNPEVFVNRAVSSAEAVQVIGIAREFVKALPPADSNGVLP